MYVSSCDGFGCFGAIIVRNGDSRSGGVGTRMSAATSATDRSTSRPDAQVREMLAAIHDPTLACFSSAHVPASMRLVIGRRGSVADSSMVTVATDDELSCARQVLASVHLEGTFAPRSVLIRFEPRSQDITPTPGGESTDAIASGESDMAASLRTALDAHASTILVCTSGEAVAVALSWTASGAIDVAVRGHLHGAPEEGCVRSALSDLRVPAGTPARRAQA